MVFRKKDFDVRFGRFCRPNRTSKFIILSFDFLGKALLRQQILDHSGQSLAFIAFNLP